MVSSGFGTTRALPELFLFVCFFAAFMDFSWPFSFQAIYAYVLGASRASHDRFLAHVLPAEVTVVITSCAVHSTASAASPVRD